MTAATARVDKDGLFNEGHILSGSISTLGILLHLTLKNDNKNDNPFRR